MNAATSLSGAGCGPHEKEKLGPAMPRANISVQPRFFQVVTTMQP